MVFFNVSMFFFVALRVDDVVVVVAVVAAAAAALVMLCCSFLHSFLSFFLAFFLPSFLPHTFLTPSFHQKTWKQKPQRNSPPWSKTVSTTACGKHAAQIRPAPTLLPRQTPVVLVLSIGMANTNINADVDVEHVWRKPSKTAKAVRTHI